MIIDAGIDVDVMSQQHMGDHDQLSPARNGRAGGSPSRTPKRAMQAGKRHARNKIV